MATTYPQSSSKLTLLANTPVYVACPNAPVTIHIPTGSTIRVELTCATAEEVSAATAEYVVWSDADKAGPFITNIPHQATTLKITAIAAPGVVYLQGAR